MIEENNSQNR